MASMKRSLAHKAVKSTAKHSAHGTASKLKREPVRATALLGLGALAGMAAAWAIGRTATGTAAVSAP
jgi:hypothetical protein